MKRTIVAGLLVGLCLMPLGCRDTVSKSVETLSPEGERVAKGINQFALDMYRELGKKEGNLVLSPFTISSALAMTYAGARGETAKEMAIALHYPLEEARFHAAMGNLLRYQQSRQSEDLQLAIAQGLWSQIPLKNDFLALVEKQYQTDFKRVDFSKDDARRVINAWGAEHTKGKITEVFPESLPGGTKIVLASAIYFKGNWDVKFSKSATMERPFDVRAGDTKNVPTMVHNAAAKFGYSSDEDFDYLELCYKGSTHSMVIALPKRRGALADAEKKLTWEKLSPGFVKQRVFVTLPRFRLSTSTDLVSSLKARGVKSLFHAADLSGMADAPLDVTQVAHATRIDVDEEGTEAASVTGVVVHASGRAEFRADHPFLFVIRDRQSGLILFIGRVADPTTI